MNISSARKLRGEGPTKYPKPAASMDNVEFFSDEFYYPKPERSPCVGMCHRSSELDRTFAKFGVLQSRRKPLLGPSPG